MALRSSCDKSYISSWETRACSTQTDITMSILLPQLFNRWTKKKHNAYHMKIGCKVISSRLFVIQLTQLTVRCLMAIVAIVIAFVNNSLRLSLIGSQLLKFLLQIEQQFLHSCLVLRRWQMLLIGLQFKEKVHSLYTYFLHYSIQFSTIHNYVQHI